MNPPIDSALWVELFDPVPNPYRPTDYNFGQGDTLFPLVDFQKYCQAHSVPTTQQWTLIRDDTGEYIAHGAYWVNAVGYFITAKAPLFSLTEDIPLSA